MGILGWLFGPKVETVDVTEVKRLQSEGAVLIDVREPHEWAAGHVHGAKLIPLGKLDRELSKLSPRGQFLFICHSGHRGARATARANREGLRAANVRGGMSRWASSGLPMRNGRRAA